MSRQLIRLSKAIPLSRLKQGGAVSIRSTFPSTNVKVISEWRDDGHVSLEQFHVEDREADVRVTQEEDRMTSMGRKESFLSVEIFDKNGGKGINSNNNNNKSTHPEAFVPSGFGWANPSDQWDGKEEPQERKIIMDDGSVIPDSEEYQNDPSLRRVDYNDGLTHVTSVEEEEEEEPETTDRLAPTTEDQQVSVSVTAIVPEKVNLSCELVEGGSIVIDNKIEGDVLLSTKQGNIIVSKLRGHRIIVQSHDPESTIYASDLLETQDLSIKTPGRVRAKQIHGQNVDVDVTVGTTLRPRHETMDADDDGFTIDVSSLYVSGNGVANLFVASEHASSKAIRVKSNHGHVQAEAHVPFQPNDDGNNDDDESPVVELGGVNGSCDVAIADKSPADSSDVGQTVTARVHVDSLSPDTISTVTSERGAISLTLDRKLEADVRLASGSSMATAARTVLSDDDAPPETLWQSLQSQSQDSISTHSKVSVVTTAFKQEAHYQDDETGLEYMSGAVENVSLEPDSRFDVETRGGKIRLDGAADQALDRFGGGGPNEQKALPLLVAGSNGAEIVVESLSWLGAIARRYGLNEEDDPGRLGRTATRRGRALAPSNETSQ